MTRRFATVALTAGLSALLIGGGLVAASAAGRNATNQAATAATVTLPAEGERLIRSQAAERQLESAPHSGVDTRMNQSPDRLGNDETRTSVRELRGRIIRSMRPVFVHRNLA